MGLLLIAPSVPSLAAGLFQPAVNYGTGMVPISVAVADFNGDGKPDLATANYNSNNISILLGNGDGTFQPAAYYGVATQPSSVAVGDFNGDGKPDLAVTIASSDIVTILLSSGDGTFRTAGSYSTGSQGSDPTAVGVGDFNGDGKPDLVVVNLAADLSILLGNGDGTFQTRVSYGVPNGANSVAVADLNGDGKPDLVVTSNVCSTCGPGSVSILLGNGNGTFQSAVNYAATNPVSVAVGDFNGDGKPDLAVANHSSSDISILLGKGDGTFSTAVSYGAGSYPQSVAAGDFNADGKLDLAVAESPTNTIGHGVAILLGNGDGSFQAVDNYAAGSNPYRVAVADLNGDGRPDLAVANLNSNNVSILLATAAAQGLLRVTSSPALPTQILVDGQIADSWGLNWMKIAPGTHTVCFTHVEGWTEPLCQTVTVSKGVTTKLVGTFTQRGSLHVVTQVFGGPPGGVAGQISVDGIPRDNWGMFTDIPTGLHTVCFGPVANFNPPACQMAAVTAGAKTDVIGNYTSAPGAPGNTGVGFLRVVSSPALATQISVDGNIADSWGLTWLEMPPGPHTVCFTHIEGYTEPACSTPTVTAGATIKVTGTFTQRGSLRVITSPAVAATILVDGIPRNDWGMWTDIPTGSHMVCFGAAAGYANTPACQPVTVNAGVETDVTGTYS